MFKVKDRDSGDIAIVYDIKSEKVAYQHSMKNKISFLIYTKTIESSGWYWVDSSYYVPIE